jgi:hypothetical protein
LGFRVVEFHHGLWLSPQSCQDLRFRQLRRQSPPNLLILAHLNPQDLLVQENLNHVRILLQNLCALDRFLEGLLLLFVSRLDLHTWSRINSQTHCLVLMKLFWHWPRINLEELTLEHKQQSVLNIRLQLLSFWKLDDCKESKGPVP